MPNIEYMISDAFNEDPDAPGEANEPGETNEPDEANAPGKANEPDEANAPGKANEPDETNAPGENTVHGENDMSGEDISPNKDAASSIDAVRGEGAVSGEVIPLGEGAVSGEGIALGEDIASNEGVALGEGIAPNGSVALGESIAPNEDFSLGAGIAIDEDAASGVNAVLDGGCGSGRDGTLDANARCEDQERLLRAFTRASNELDELYRMMAKELGLSLSAYDILVVLRDNDGCHQKDLCDACYLTKQTVSSSVRAMERDGLVRVEPGGGRQTRIVLTDEGRALVDDRLSMVYAAEKRAFSRMSASDQVAFIELTNQFTASLRAEFAHLGSDACASFGADSVSIP